jgi:hypothetical protein
MKRIASYLIALATMAFTFTSCEDVPSPFGEIVKPSGEEKVVIDPAGSGTEADPYNVAAVVELCSGLASGSQTDKDVYVKGIVTEIKDIDTSGTYGNATYWISDDADGKANKFYIYRGFGLGGKKFNEGATPVKAGDKIVIKSPVMNYNGTYETVQNKCIIVELNGIKDSGSGGGDTPSGTDIGSKDAPITCAKALELIKALADGGESDGKAFVKGKVIKVTTNQENFEKYGNLNYLISDDGSEANAITVYSGDGLNGEKFKGITDLAAGDEVIVYGKLYKYVNKSGQMTPEINKGNYLVSLVKGSGGGGDTPTPTAGDGDGSEAKPYNVTAAIAKAEQTGVYVKGFIVGFVDGQAYDTGATFSDAATGKTNVLIAASASETDPTKCMPVQLPNGAIREGLNLQDNKGNYKKEVTLYGDIATYFRVPGIKNTTYALIDGKAIGTKPGEESGGGSGGGGTASGTGTLDNPLTPSQVYDIVAAMENGKTSSEDYYVKGKISSIKFTFSAEYGTATFNFSDDGKTGGKEFIAYGTYYKAFDQKWKDGDTQIAVGDEVVVCGKVVNYNGNTPEFANKKSYVVKINGK